MSLHLVNHGHLLIFQSSLFRHFQYLLGGLTVTMYSPAGEMQFVDQISPAQGPQSSLGQETSVARVTRRGPHFAIPPYLTHLGPTGAVLNWRFDSSKIQQCGKQIHAASERLYDLSRWNIPGPSDHAGYFQ